MKKTVLAVTAALAIASASMAIPASAADLEFLPPPPPPLVPTWQGFYLGGHVGYGEADFHTRVRQRAPGGFRTRTDLRAGGLIGGVQGGYNWQLDSWVLGIEGDVSFTDWHDSGRLVNAAGARVGSARADVDLLASIRGRAGIAFDSLLIYGTGGAAFADGNLQVRSGGATSRRSIGDWGWVVGGGASWMVVPQTFSLGVEGLFYFFDDKKTVFTNPAIRVRGEMKDAWVIRARGDFHF